MTGKRFVIEDGYYQAKSRPLIYDNGSGDDDYYFCGDYDDFKDICKLLNELNDKNQRLKEIINQLYDEVEFLKIDNDSLNDGAEKYSKLYYEVLQENKELKVELQKIYDNSTVIKVKSIVNEVYDDLLYETSEESDYARKKVLQCLEKIDEFGDDFMI